MDVPWYTAESGDLLWPPAAVLAGAETLPTDVPPWDRLVSGAAAVFGILPAVSGTGVTLLESWLQRSSALRIRLVIPVYPGGRTLREDLRRLLALHTAYPARLRVGILPLAAVADRASLALCFAGVGSHADYLTVGAYEHFRPGQGSALGPALVCRLGDGVAAQLLSYLGALEPHARPIESAGTVDIPEIALRKPTQSDQDLWRAYRAPSVLATGSPVTAAMLANELRLPVRRAPASFAETIAALYARGKLVTVNEETRLPPLEAPVRPEVVRLFRRDQGWRSEGITKHAGEPVNATRPKGDRAGADCRWPTARTVHLWHGHEPQVVAGRRRRAACFGDGTRGRRRPPGDRPLARSERGPVSAVPPG